MSVKVRFYAEFEQRNHFSFKNSVYRLHQIKYKLLGTRQSYIISFFRQYLKQKMEFNLYCLLCYKMCHRFSGSSWKLSVKCMHAKSKCYLFWMETKNFECHDENDHEKLMYLEWSAVVYQVKSQVSVTEISICIVSISMKRGVYLYLILNIQLCFHSTGSLCFALEFISAALVRTFHRTTRESFDRRTHTNARARSVQNVMFGKTNILK